MAKRYYLGLDNGGTITKGAILDIEKKALIAVDSIKTEMLFPAPERTEKDMDQLWRANVTVIRNVLAATGIKPEEIGGIAVTGHGNGLYMVDSEGRQTHNGIVSTDTRADKYAEQAISDGVFDRVHPRILQSLWGAQPPMLIQWFKDNDPAVLDRTRYFLLVKDFIRFRLTGEAYSELTDISAISLMDKSNPSKLDETVFKEFGLSEYQDKFPPIRNSHDCCGHITPSVAKETGLAEGTPVYGGIFDITSCCIASGVVDPSLLSIISGTWSINQFISEQYIDDKNLFMTSIYCMPGWNLVTEASATGASNLEWFVTNVMDQEKKECDRKGTSIFDYCEALVAKTTPDPSLLFIPHLFGSNSSTASGGCFLGLKSYHGKADLCRAVYEGVVLSHVHHIEHLKTFGLTARTARLTGGAARSAMWSKMFADAIGMKVETVEGEEFGIIGTLCGALVGSGCSASYRDAAEMLVRVQNYFEPNPEMREYYLGKYDRYKQAVTARITEI